MCQPVSAELPITFKCICCNCTAWPLGVTVVLCLKAATACLFAAVS